MTKYKNNLQIYDTIGNLDSSGDIIVISKQVNMMMLVEIFFVGLVLPFANSNYDYDYDPNSNYNSNATIEDCNDKLSENECFCYDEPEADIPYSICKESVLLSGKSSLLRLRFDPGQTF